MKPLVGTDLKRFLRDYKRAHKPQRKLKILLQSVEYPYNVGAIFRLADGAGVEELILTGITPCPPHPTIDKVARGKTRLVKWQYGQEPLPFLQELRRGGYLILALEITDGSGAYDKYDYPERVCLVLGHEDHGLTKKTLSACDSSIFIPMYGKGRSHNVATAAAIAAYQILHSTG